MTSHAVDTEDRKGLARMGHVLLHEFRLVVPPTLFFFVGFNLILLTKRLFLADYLIAYTGFLIATTSALVVGKVVLVADKLPLLKSLDDQPLAYPILFKTIVYTVFVFIARLLEALVHFLIEGNMIGGGAFIRHELGQFTWPHFIAVQLWIFVLFFNLRDGKRAQRPVGRRGVVPHPLQASVDLPQGDASGAHQDAGAADQADRGAPAGGTR